MKIKHWQGNTKDIATYPIGVKDASLSVLANSVNAANYDLCSLLKSGDRVMEIGCGSYSWLKENLVNGVLWDGIDVIEEDFNGNKCIHTRLGSVDQIPFPNDTFDWILSNQSIEHWFEYNVRIPNGLDEIARVLHVGGQAHINFPFYLHGHPHFVKGELSSILSYIDKLKWTVLDVIIYLDSEEEDYCGWKKCGFPTWYVQSNGMVNTSYVVNIVLKKISDEQDAHPEAYKKKLTIKPQISRFKIVLIHGFFVTIYKIFNSLFTRIQLLSATQRLVVEKAEPL
jgi:hypothetical protein